MKNRNFIKNSILLLLPISMGVGVLLGVTKTPVYETDAYTASSLPTTIDLNDTDESVIRNYYSNLNNLTDESERKGNNLLKNLKPILMQNQKYYKYDSSDAIWKMYEIVDRDWTKSPTSQINGDYGTYDSSTNKITGYEYGSNSNPKSNPYLHALYTNRDAENPKRAWGSHGDRSSAATIEREHIWPKSHGFDSGSEAGARGDPMHLWAADGTANGMHSNLFYGYVKTSGINVTYTDAGSKHSILAGNLTGTSKTLGSGTVFEPQDSDKGDIARACFYMVARYNNIAGTDNNISGANPNLTLSNSLSENNRSGTSTSTDAYSLGILSDLLEWNRIDPPDEFEIHRNNLLYTNYTNNRNPFIDFPEWADIAFGNSTSSANPKSDSVSKIGETKTVSSISVSTNPTKTTYTEGETFDPTGLKLSVTYSDNTSNVVSSGFTYSPDGVLSTSNTSITISYGGKTTSVPITVNSSGGGQDTPSGEKYSITFTNNDGDSSSSLTAANFKGQISSGKDYVDSVSEISSVYSGKSGIKMSSSTYSGAFTLNFKTAISNSNAKKITINAAKWISPNGSADTSDIKVYLNGSETALISFNTNSALTGSASLSNAKISSVKISSSKRAYITGLDIEMESSSISPTSLSVNPSSLDLDVGDSTSLTATVLPSNATNKSVSWTSSDSTVVSVSSTGVLRALKPGTATITCTSAAVSTLSASCSVTVLEELELHHISIVGPTKETYNQGEEFDSSGLVVTAHYYRGQTEALTEDVTDEAEVSGYNPSTIGNQTITVSFGGKNETFTVKVNEVIEENTLVFNYQNQSYTNGQAVNSLEIENFTVSFKKNNGTQPAYYTTGNAVRLYKNNDIEVTGPYKIKKITIETPSTNVELTPSCGTYSNGVWSSDPEDFVKLSKTTSDDLFITRIKVQYDPNQVVRAPLSSITLSGYKYQFYKGDSFSSEGLVVTAHYSDGSTQVVNPTSVSTPNMTYNGDKNVTVTYIERGVTATETYSINMKNDTVLSIALSGDYKTSFNVGDTFDYSGLVVAATWESGKTTYPSTSECTFKGQNMNSVGTQKITVTYSGVKEYYDITVSEKTRVYGNALYTFINSGTSTQNVSTWNSTKFMECVACDGDSIITGMSTPSNAYIGGNGGSGTSTWNIWNSLKLGKSGGSGSIKLALDDSIYFTSIKVKAIALSKTDSTLTINGITKNVSKVASKNDLEPIELTYDITGEISELTLSTYNSTSNNYSVLITSIEFISQVTPTKTLQSISLSGSYKTDFSVGETFSFSGTVTANYSDNSTDNVTSEASFTGYDLSSTGDQTVTVSYTENSITKTTTYTIHVTSSTVLTSISLSGNYKTTFIQDESFDFSGMYITEHFNDGSSSDPISVTSLDLFSGYDMSTGGDQTVAVTYKGLTATYGIKVIERPSATVHGDSQSGYFKVTDSLKINDKIVLVYENSKKQLNGFTTSSTIVGVADSYENTPKDKYSLTVVAGSKANTYSFVNVDNQYLCWNSGNGLTTSSQYNDKSSWTIEFSQGNAIIKNADTPDRLLQYNATNPRFACYLSSSNQNSVQIYRFENIDDSKLYTASIDLTKALMSAQSILDTACGSKNVTTANWNSIKGLISPFLSDSATDDYKALMFGKAKSSELNGNMLEDFLARYDLITSTYGYEKFIANGSQVRASTERSKLTIKALSSDNILLIVCTSIATLAIGGYFFFRRKKEEI